MVAVDGSCLRLGVVSMSYGCKHKNNQAFVTVYTYNSTRCAGEPIEEMDASAMFVNCMEVPGDQQHILQANSVAYNCFARDRTPQFARDDGLTT